MNLKGFAHVYGDNVDTDRIIPGKYTKTLDLSNLAEHVLEDLDPEFIHKIKDGDILVAGENFGCGSSREQAPLAIKAAGISVVVAKSFARIFYRNAINIGLPLIELPDHSIRDHTELSINLKEGIVIETDTDQVHHSNPMPPVMIDILNHDGLVNYLKVNGDYHL
ncbi:3-isopropylmalate dehydratase small subunit [Fictibacillus enclensis]|uniref:3-isopropylmalate dehydratase small subunit n=1 Tax=Fictibacillus enclensis TaxID=1017270 RepID=UPI0025A2E58F|nr:3-isopropylmalate dehydratase small subunit [Fictibacillus enclensis]MDM5336625.1 3-isopropylmalate dehydratase small subunit [Fictibacillus enclensis]